MLIHMCLVYNIAAVVHNLTLGLATGRVMDLLHVSVLPWGGMMPQSRSTPL
jgi:hypothetical protein